MGDYRIMVVEDEGIVALDIQQSLLTLGYQVAGVASSGEEALEKAVKTHPDLLLMDIRLGEDMDGVDVAMEIGETQDIPVVFLTAYSDQDTVERAKQVLPYGYLIKPFDDVELQTTIEMALHKHDLERHFRQRELWLGNVLGSISDGVAASDAEGNILFLNQGAQAMTGWPEAEALFQSLETILPLMDAAGEKLVPHPGTRSLKTGEVLEPAENIQLLNREGIRIAVECSTAPILGRRGELNGVVMVFRAPPPRAA